jgi:hypothetical protein
MGVNRSFALGFAFAMVLWGCAGFSYHYYGLAEVDFSHGTLLAPSAKDDLPFSKCAPNGQSKNPCVVMLTTDFFALRQDYDDVKTRLSDCEKAAGK